jgi:hypothetical protein
VAVGKIRDRARGFFQLPENILYVFLQPLEKVEDDEMLNRIEFSRFLAPYTTTHGLSG